MEIGDLIYVLIGVVWLIYSFLKKGKKKTTSDLSGDEMTEQPVEEYLPSNLSRLSAEQAGTEDWEVVEQAEDPYETVRKEIRERERAGEKLEVALSSLSPSPVLNALEGLPQKPPKSTLIEKPTLRKDEREESYIEQLKGASKTPALTLTQSLHKKREVLSARHNVSAGGRARSPLPFREELPDFNLRKAVIFYEILKRPEY